VIDAAALERCLAAGGIVVFPSDTVYGLACNPEDQAAVHRLYHLKHRDPSKPSAVMFFHLGAALGAVPELGSATRAALMRLLPGQVSLLLANPSRLFPLACGEDPDTLGVRVPALPDGGPLSGLRVPVLQSSANRAGGPDPRRLADVPEQIREAADLVLDGGDLPGTPSTVIDLRAYEHDRTWTVVREGAVARETLVPLLSSRQ
jgi:L-threonylcarbamoyladenylate synthase